MKKLKLYAGYALYFLITLEERNKYGTGQLKGCECTNIQHGAIFTKVETDHDRPANKRNFLNWKEYKQLHS